MDWFDSWGLTLAIFLPLVGALLILLVPREQEGAHKAIALLTTGATLAVGIGLLTQFDYDKTQALQFDVNKSWIDVISSSC